MAPIAPLMWWPEAPAAPDPFDFRPLYDPSRKHVWYGSQWACVPQNGTSDITPTDRDPGVH